MVRIWLYSEMPDLNASRSLPDNKNVLLENTRSSNLVDNRISRWKWEHRESSTRPRKKNSIAGSWSIVSSAFAASLGKASCFSIFAVSLPNLFWSCSSGRNREQWTKYWRGFCQRSQARLPSSKKQARSKEGRVSP